jgi:hypothetical protein
MKNLFVVAISIIVFASCQKDNDININPTINYLPLDIGNYWVYQEFNIDEDGISTETSKFDSIIIVGDTLINNNTFYVFTKTKMYSDGTEKEFIDFLRDSSGYIVDENGRRRFSEDNFIDTIYKETQLGGLGDTIYTCSYRMENTEIMISVPAGEFEVLNVRGTVIDKQENHNHDPRYTNSYYANGVGRVLSTYFWLGAPDSMERRLIRYHVK